MNIMCILDISEADLIYTETIMARGKEDYRDKEIVILGIKLYLFWVFFVYLWYLGGGDGALLYELLKEQPRYVTMLEIDDIVMKACAKHMRSICGDVLDRRSDKNYEVNISIKIKFDNRGLNVSV